MHHLYQEMVLKNIRAFKREIYKLMEAIARLYESGEDPSNNPIRVTAICKWGKHRTAAFIRILRILLFWGGFIKWCSLQLLCSYLYTGKYSCKWDFAWSEVAYCCADCNPENEDWNEFVLENFWADWLDMTRALNFEAKDRRRECQPRAR